MTSFSFEFFPPKTPESLHHFWKNLDKLVSYQPTHVSVTYGAGGTTQNFTLEIVEEILNRYPLTVVPHLTCIGASYTELGKLLTHYANLGLNHILALRGDLPRNQGLHPAQTGPRHAIHLIQFIKKEFPHFTIGGACYPEGHFETHNRITEMRYLKEKVDAGLSYLCTQMFFDNYYFYQFLEQLKFHQIAIPVTPGILPLSLGFDQAQRMSELSKGTLIPAQLLTRLKSATTKVDAKKVGLSWCAQQVSDLRAHQINHIHFYTLNSANGIEALFQALNIQST